MSGLDDASDPVADESREESQKSYQTILTQEIEAGLKELERPAWGLLISSLSAGRGIGFSPFFFGPLLPPVKGGPPPPIVRMLGGQIYAPGFLFFLFRRPPLFT